MTAENTDQKAAARAAAKAGQRQKFEWLKAVGADKELQSSTKVIAVMAAFHYAGAKGHFHATRQTLSKISGMSASTVDRAITELCRQTYWDIEDNPGRANRYIIIPPEERLQLWLEAEADRKSDWLNAEKRHKQAVRQWLDAEVQYGRAVQRWLDAEVQCDYESQAYRAFIARGATPDFATSYAQRAWERSIALQELLDLIAQAPQDAFTDREETPANEAAEGSQGSSPMTSALITHDERPHHP